MMKIIYLIVLLVLGSCGANMELINSLKLEEGERGAVCVRGELDMNANPFVTSNVSFAYSEHSEGEEPIDC